jgi:hypothetical protein
MEICLIWLVNNCCSMIWKLVVGWGALLVVFELIRRTLWNSRQGTLQNENNSLNQVATFDTLQSQIERCWLKDIKYENSCKSCGKKNAMKNNNFPSDLPILVQGEFLHTL